MILADFLAGVFVTGALAWVTYRVYGFFKLRNAMDLQHLHNVKMQDDLWTALRSGEYRKLDDWLAVYKGSAPDDLQKYVETRRDEMIVGSEK